MSVPREEWGAQPWWTEGAESPERAWLAAPLDESQRDVLTPCEQPDCPLRQPLDAEAVAKTEAELNAQIERDEARWANALGLTRREATS